LVSVSLSKRHLLEAPISQEDVEPRVELTRFIETPQISERVEKRALGGIGSIRVVARESPRVCERPSLIPLNQMAKRVDLAVSTPPDGLSVSHSVSSSTIR
jgi:hypothetical protein